MKKSRADRYRREHAVAIEKMRRTTDRPLAPRRRRMQLSVAYVAVGTGAVLLPLVTDERWSSVGQVVATCGLVALWIGLRRATRLVTDAPDEALDDMLVRLRDGYYREAYRWLGVAVLLAATLMGWFGREGMSGEIVDALRLALFALVMGLPLVVAALRLPDVGDEP